MLLIIVYVHVYIIILHNVMYMCVHMYTCTVMYDQQHAVRAST